MARVLSISSQVAWGPVGNSAAVPAMMGQGVEVMALPTILLSNHPGHGKPEGTRIAAPTLAAMLARLEELGTLNGLDGILTGYFADAEQVETAARFIAKFPKALYLCDPVIGDDPKGLYVPESVAEAIRARLLPLAKILTPNRFEREWLGDVAHVPELMTTSLPEGENLITELQTPKARLRHATRKVAGVPHGTGDLLAGLYLAQRLRQEPETAFPAAMAGLETVITRSLGKPGLQLP